MKFTDKSFPQKSLLQKAALLLTAILTLSLNSACSFEQPPVSFSQTASPVFSADTNLLTDTSFLVWLDFNGNIRKVDLTKSNGHKKIKIHDCRKNSATPILLYRDENDMTPLGTIYPYSNDFTVQGGFAADILLHLYTASLQPVSKQSGSPITNVSQQTQTVTQIQQYLSHFNWIRFMEELKPYPDPWILDRQTIMQKIAGRNFSKTDIKPLL